MLFYEVVAAATCPLCARVKGQRLHAPSALSHMHIFQCGACRHVWGSSRDLTPPRHIPAVPLDESPATL